MSFSTKKAERRPLIFTWAERKRTKVNLKYKADAYGGNQQPMGKANQGKIEKCKGPDCPVVRE